MKKVSVLSCICFFNASSLAEAANPIGSHRVGGYNSSGKGNHYVCGHK